MKEVAQIKDHLASLICKAMYMEKEALEDDALFSDFGLESTTLAKILTEIRERYECEFKVEEFLSHQTLNEASVYIFDKIPHPKQEKIEEDDAS